MRKGKGPFRVNTKDALAFFNLVFFVLLLSRKKRERVFESDHSKTPLPLRSGLYYGIFALSMAFLQVCEKNLRKQVVLPHIPLDKLQDRTYNAFK